MKDISVKIKTWVTMLKNMSVPKLTAIISPKGAMREYTTPGAGAGKGGGAGGAVKEAGGGLGKYGAAQEEGYFYNLAKEQLKKLKQMVKGDEETKAKEDEKK